QEAHAIRDRFGRKSDRRRPRADDRLVRYRKAAEHARPEAGNCLVDLLGGQELASMVAVVERLPLQRGQARMLLVGPCAEDRPRPFQWYPRLPRVIAKQLVAAADEPGLQGARRRIEAGVQDR